MGKALVIVESPTKARTISKFLDADFVVESSVGHIRDLPSSAKEVPAKWKKEKWSSLGIDIENDFKPLYIVPSEKKKQVDKLKKLLKDAEELYLATDEDREGEAISWHLCEVLKPKVKPRRLVFHEITKEAIHEALANPREIDEKLVEAQETRRLLDRLYGYQLSPVLWKKIRRGLSAGRVQSVAVRIIVKRERERMAFVPATYWDLTAAFEPIEGEKRAFETQLISLGGKRIASGRDFDETTGQLKTGGREVVLLGEQEAQDLRTSLHDASWACTSLERKPYTNRPAPPFTTSTLQQEANRKLRLSARRTMQSAQRLYEQGFITYMRTDSVHLAEQAVGRIRELVADLYGADHIPEKPRSFKNKVKNAQEAHEAIRPSMEFHRPEELKGKVGADEIRLYELIWKRAVACQMADARGHRMTIQISDGEAGQGGAVGATFQASGKTIEFPGFLRAYVEGSDNPDAELADKEIILPDLAVGAGVIAKSVDAKDHTTQPPARFTEASLVKELEANGVGRPSTYATIIDTIQHREYAVKQGNALVPTFTAFAVTELMEKHFGSLVDVQFTARMEDDLDNISVGTLKALPYLKDFYFGIEDRDGLSQLIERDIDARASCTLPLGKDAEGREVNIRVGRYGSYLERGEGERASIPDGIAPDELDMEKAEELFRANAGLGTDPATGKPIFAKTGRYGPYVQLGESDDDDKKMRSLPKDVDLSNVTVEVALKYLSLPRTVGNDPENDNEEILADLGRWGPYIKCGKESRSLKGEDDVFDLTEARAIELLRTPKEKGRGRFQPKVLKELGKLPGNEEVEIRVLDGRYGPYVSDGETHASLPKGTAVDGVGIEFALTLLEERRARGGSKKKKKKSTAKKTAAKKKSTAKKSTAKKKSTKTAAKKKSTKTAAKKKTTASKTTKKIAEAAASD